jgi:hypothetical protein
MYTTVGIHRDSHLRFCAHKTYIRERVFRCCEYVIGARIVYVSNVRQILNRPRHLLGPQTSYIYFFLLYIFILNFTFFFFYFFESIFGFRLCFASVCWLRPSKGSNLRDQSLSGCRTRSISSIRQCTTRR